MLPSLNLDKGKNPMKNHDYNICNQYDLIGTGRVPVVRKQIMDLFQASLKDKSNCVETNAVKNP